MAEEIYEIFYSLVKTTLLMSRRLRSPDFVKINGGTITTTSNDEGMLPEKLGLLITCMSDFLLDRFGQEKTPTKTFYGKLQLENVLDDWLPLLEKGGEMSVLDNRDLDAPVHISAHTIEVGEYSNCESLTVLTSAAGKQYPYPEK